MQINEVKHIETCTNLSIIYSLAVNFIEAKKIESAEKTFAQNLIKNNINTCNDLAMDVKNNFKNDKKEAFKYLLMLEDYTGSYWENFSKQERQFYGKYFTPKEVVEYMVNLVNIKKIINNDDFKILDPACGAGIFLLEIIKSISKEINIKNNNDFNNLLTIIDGSIFGLDVDPTACVISKISILLNIFKMAWDNNLNILETDINDINLNIFNTDTIDLNNNNNKLINNIKNCEGNFSDGFDLVIGNPPYIEAKKMDNKYRDKCRDYYGDRLYGAFDMYTVFMHFGLDHLKDDGNLIYIIPNKFLITKYSLPLRKTILNDYKLNKIIDLSEVEVFKNTGVYPIILHIENKAPTEIKTLNGLNKIDDLNNKNDFKNIHASLYKNTGKNNTYFVMPEIDLKETLEMWLSKSDKDRLGYYANIASTVSFHKKGLREKYISKGVDEGEYKYLGGKSYAKKNEIRRYMVNWKGYGINYDQDSLKKIGNKLPPLNIFMRSKVIFCQHEKKLTSYCDLKGEFVSKDVYPVAYFKEEYSDLSEMFLSALFNSDLYSVLYAVVYKGIQISSGYYHFLPTYLKELPFVIPNKDLRIKIINKAKQIQNLLEDESNANKNEAKKIHYSLQDDIYDLFGISKKQRSNIKKYLDKYDMNFVY